MSFSTEKPSALADAEGPCCQMSATSRARPAFVAVPTAIGDPRSEVPVYRSDCPELVWLDVPVEPAFALSVHRFRRQVCRAQPVTVSLPSPTAINCSTTALDNTVANLDSQDISPTPITPPFSWRWRHAGTPSRRVRVEASAPASRLRQGCRLVVRNSA